MKPALGAPLTDLVRIAAYVGIAAFSFAVLHYFGVLGAGAETVGTRERSEYDTLRQRIVAGNWIAREYARRLDAFLNAVDRFFGDAGMADRTLFPHAFGLRKPAPLWTAPAFDRCLLLALVYPVAAIVLIWAISNHAGPAELALGLQSTVGWRRAATLVAIGFFVFALRRTLQARGSRRFAWLTLALAFMIVVIVAFASAGPFVGAVTIAGIIIGIGIGGGKGVSGLFVVTLLVVLAVTAGVAIVFVSIFAIAHVLAVVVVVAPLVAVGVGFTAAFGFLQEISKERGLEGILLAISVLVTFLVCFADAWFLSHLDMWAAFGPMVLFLGLLTLINAPFDWLSLGLTRALMRRGLEREKWWPYLYAAIDALLASIVIALLAMAMVAGVQLFEDLTVHGGGERILPPMSEFLEFIEAHPGMPQYWWVYATLFSTMLPSLINLFIASVSLARGVPGVSSWLLDKVREGEAVPAYDRLLVAIVLALQGVAGFAIALVAQGFLFWVIIWQGMPRLGIGVLDLAHFVAH